MKKKPRCKLVGRDGNVFSLSFEVSRILREAGLLKELDEFQKKLLECESYGQALSLMMKYVEIY